MDAPVGAADAAKGLFDEFFVGSGRSKKGRKLFVSREKSKMVGFLQFPDGVTLESFKNFDMLTTN